MNTVTLGVQAVVIDDHDRIFLVRHSYIPGWHLPGGGVEIGETLLQALTRELAEYNLNRAADVARPVPELTCFAS